MSQANVELADRGVRAINETYRTGDLAPWRGHVEETCDDDLLIEATNEAFTEGEWRGHDGAVGFVANQMEVLEDMWLRVDEHTDVADECLLLAVTFGGRARHTGIEVELHPFHVLFIREGKVVRWMIFQDRDQAMEAAGLAD